jgi:serine protease Do
MLAGDVIINFDGDDVADTRALVRRVGNTAIGKAVRVVVFRDGKTQTLLVTLGRREEAESAVPAAMDAPGDEGATETEMLGLKLSTLTDEFREQLGIGDDMDGLVVVDVEPTSEAYEKGLRAGDLITEAGQQKISDIKGLEERVEATKEAGRKSLLLLVRRAGDPRFVALSLQE